jgi:Zn-finger nucleic acid-binding protein
MKCPRCDGLLDERERQGVTVDVCPGCRGVWLDRGELEKLLAFVHDGQGRVVLDPDTQVQESVRLLFDTFRRTGAARQTVKHFRTERVLFPARVVARAAGTRRDPEQRQRHPNHREPSRKTPDWGKMLQHASTPLPPNGAPPGKMIPSHPELRGSRRALTRSPTCRTSARFDCTLLLKPAQRAQ